MTGAYYARLGADGAYHIYRRRRGIWQHKLLGTRRWHWCSPAAGRELDALARAREES